MSKFDALRKKICEMRIKLGFMDAETSHLEAKLFRIGSKICVRASQITKPTKIISIGWKFEWYDEPKYLHWNAQTQDDSVMLKHFVKIANSAKCWIAQNGDKFDFPTLQYRLYQLGLPPLTNVVTIDTLKCARSSFRAPSCSLDSLAKDAGLGGKTEMVEQDWYDVENKVPGALEKMVSYMQRDVTLLQGVFWYGLPYFKTLPISLATLINETRDHCPRCASHKKRKYDVYPTKVDNKDRLRCDNCGHIWKETRKQ